MRFVVLIVALASVGCAQELSENECLELMLKETEFVYAKAPSREETLALHNMLAKGCPSKRSRKDYDCIMDASDAGQYAACLR